MAPHLPRLSPRRRRRGSYARERRRFGWLRCLLLATGLGVVLLGLVWARSPYEGLAEFRRATSCDAGGERCLPRETGQITGRDTYTTTSTTTHTDANGTTWTDTTTTTHYDVELRRADGSSETHDVGLGFYNKVREGDEAEYRVWQGAVVSVRAHGRTQTFEPPASGSLWGWGMVSWLGAGISAWALLMGWWDGLFMLVWRTFVWMFLGLVPVRLVAEMLGYGLPTGWGLVVAAFELLWFSGIAGAMLIGSLTEDW